jgi:DNA modification methylase
MNQVLFGDCRDSMRKLIADGVKVQTCITSPPYYGLRDYGHEGQIGLEEKPSEYVGKLVEVFSLVWDLLVDDGVMWVNLGDSYGGDRGNVSHAPDNKHKHNAADTPGKSKSGTLRKQLLGIPWRVAFALQDAGWYLRQDIIWSKPNAMPESVTDRCTKSHEYVFLLAKQERYYFDNEAIKEKANPDSSIRDRDATRLNNTPGRTKMGGLKKNDYEMRNKRSVWTVPTKPYSGAHFAVFPPALIEPMVLASTRAGDIVLDPFLGSGTTAQVAQDLGRNWIGCELNPDYAQLQQQRTAQQALCL